MQNFRNLHQATGRFITVENINYLFAGGTAYLGLLTNPQYTELYKKGIDIYGLNNGTSRTNNIQLGIYDEAEEYLANRFLFDSAALLSSGYLAAQVVVKTFANNNPVFYAPDTHPSLWLTENPNHTQDFEIWANDVIERINQSLDDEFVIVANALDNLTPRRYDFSVFNKIDSSKKILLILDDSHGIGVLKKDRVSIDVSKMGSNIEVLVLASLAKGLGTDAGVILGNKERIVKIKNHPIFIGASPANPAALYAMVNAGDIYEYAYHKLHQNILQFEALIRSYPLKNIPKFPVFTSLDPNLYQYLISKRVLISSFPYPLATSSLLNRIVISAVHEKEDIQKIAELLTIGGH
ncbi:aminotransferase class I/II-fold pyridoxal phosphate-dependent enzyme [Sphingobacterium sp. HJSM2_6]|uniref:aminotransferase class I/II-fold pyridoxal phosphate-dependent enzyme n=1 Tax=Sphingobacterium sp. HJSM2_6 TaxID=3366264 RepID=UPI003BEC4933